MPFFAIRLRMGRLGFCYYFGATRGVVRSAKIAHMESHLVARPKKTVFPNDEQLRLRSEAIDRMKEVLLPNDGIEKILLIGSSVKGTFGEYDVPGFRGSLYSDFDFIVFVQDDYQIPETLQREPDGKPFPDDNLNLAYRLPRFLHDKYDAEIFFIRKNASEKPDIQALGEAAGIPMNDRSKHSHLRVYP